MKKIETKYVVAIIISVILGVSVLGYGYLDYRYKREVLEQQIREAEQAKTEKEIKEQAEDVSNTAKQIQLQACLDDVSERMSEAFKDTTTNLTVEEIKIVLDFIQKQKDECFRKYPQE